MAGSFTPYQEHSVVRTLVQKTDDQGRVVESGAEGTIVHVHPTSTSEPPAYIVEVVLTDERGVQDDAHIFDARHDELEIITRLASEADGDQLL